MGNDDEMSRRTLSVQCTAPAALKAEVLAVTARAGKTNAKGDGNVHATNRRTRRERLHDYK